MYRLRTSPASPFGRKVALAAAATGLADRLVIEPADVNDPNDSLLEQIRWVKSRRSLRRWDRRCLTRGSSSNSWMTKPAAAWSFRATIPARLTNVPRGGSRASRKGWRALDYAELH